MGTSGAAETFYVVASTDLQRSGIMITRIREQLERVTDLKAKCTLTITTVAIELPATEAAESVDQQVQSVAGCVTQMILSGMERKQLSKGKSAKSVN